MRELSNANGQQIAELADREFKRKLELLMQYQSRANEYLEKQVKGKKQDLEDNKDVIYQGNDMISSFFKGLSMAAEVVYLMKNQVDKKILRDLEKDLQGVKDNMDVVNNHLEADKKVLEAHKKLKAFGEEDSPLKAMALDELKEAQDHLLASNVQIAEVFGINSITELDKFRNDLKKFRDLHKEDVEKVSELFRGEGRRVETELSLGNQLIIAGEDFIETLKSAPVMSKSQAMERENSKEFILPPFDGDISVENFDRWFEQLKKVNGLEDKEVIKEKEKDIEDKEIKEVAQEVEKEEPEIENHHDLSR